MTGELLKLGATIAKGRYGAWICTIGVFISLMGCQQQIQKTPSLPPAPPPVAPLPQPVRPTFYVTVNQLNLRACAGRDCPKISTLEINAEVEGMGEIENWTQIRVKKDGTIGYVNSRYLSPTPMEVIHPTRKKPKKIRPPKGTKTLKPVEEERKAPPKRPPSAGEETKPGKTKPAPPPEPEGNEIPRVM
jgi:SH3-like domain-containing protein